MKRIYIITLLIFVVLFVCAIFLYAKNENRCITPNLINTTNIILDENTLSYSGKIIGNSFVGDFSKYKYKIDGEVLYLYIYCEKISTDYKQEINFTIHDAMLKNVTKVYLKGKQESVLIWSG